MKEKGNPLLQIIRNVNDAVVVVLFLAMTITVIIQVFFRFVIQSPLRWTEELARYLMILMASAIAMRNRSHLQVDVLTSALPQKPKRILTAIVDLLTIVFLCIMTYFGFKVVQSTTAQTSPAMQIPMALIYAAFPTGGVLMIMEQLLTFIERLKNKNAPEEPREFID
jgi:TRAP-type C4-dicarboxylate transport system permease small subunit